MSIHSSQFSINSTAVKFAEADGMPLEVHIHAKGTIYIGNPSVTTSTGLQMDNGDKLVFTVPDGSSLWAVSASGSQSASVLVAVL
jgi:hypothetical protein